MINVPIEAVSAAIFHDGRFLLVRRGRAPALGLYAFPGGRVEKDETLDEAVRREVLEETGARVENIALIRAIEIVSESDEFAIEFILNVHRAEYAGGEVAAGDDADEVIWVSVGEMEKLPLAGSVLDIARQIALTG